ncbi:MAG: HAD family hydrolase [Phormidesmis sp.]
MATICCRGHIFENIQAVLFDKDGTLADVEAYLIALGRSRAQMIAERVRDLPDGLLLAFGQQGNAIAPDGLMAVGSRDETKVAAAAYVAATGIGWIAALNVVESAFQQAKGQLPLKVSQTPPLKGTSELLTQLEQAGVKLAIVSSDTHQEVAAFITHYQLTEISWYCGAQALTLPKTDPNFLTFACEAMAISPAETLVIGDSAADFALARRGAAGFIAMTGGWQRSPVIEGAATTAQSLRQVEVFR